MGSPPAENKSMKRATSVGITTTTVFYVLCGCVGYAAFGNDAPGNFLTGFGFYEPFWLVDIANICIAIHLIGAYQVSLAPFMLLNLSTRFPFQGCILTIHISWMAIYLFIRSSASPYTGLSKASAPNAGLKASS